MRAKDIMSTPVVTARSDTTLKTIATTLVAHAIGAVPIVDENGDLVGIVTEGDLVRLQAIPDPRLHAIPQAGRRQEPAPARVVQVMSRNVVTADEDEDVTAIARRMLLIRLKHIPIVSGRKVVGMISRRDILKVLARGDDSIEAELQQRLDDESELLGRFFAKVADGVVTLSGPDEEGPRKLVRLLARTIPGLVDVVFDDEAQSLP